MGNRICRANGRSSRSIEERFTRPHRLVRQPSNVDYKKLRKLILSEKLAPCFDGVEDSNPDLEECPICFFFYPSLNRSRCCMKGICTECFLQMKPSNATDRPTQCPFCKFVSYAVEYRGAKTEEEKSLEQAEEQKVLEAKIRMQSEDTDRVTLANCISSDVETQVLGSNFGPRSNYRGDTQDGRDPHMAALEEMTVVAPSMDRNYSNGRHEDLDLDLEEIMMTEAIWRSIQDLGQSCGSSSNVELASSGHESNECGPSSASMDERDVPSADSINAGLAVAIARMAEHNIQRAEMLQFIRENNNLKQSDDAVRPTGASADHELNEAHLKGGCLESFSSISEDDSWGLLASCLLAENPGLESGFVSDRDLVSEVADDERCSSSSIQPLSDGSGESSDCSNDGVDTSCSHLSTSFTVVRPVVMSPNAAA